ncbi:hypothetical protein Ddc_15105 [Ditylenchus destructor]|nr:hypothetical protein Ddc_15105 [Ditylenchus destructor]
MEADENDEISRDCTGAEDIIENCELETLPQNSRTNIAFVLKTHLEEPLDFAVNSDIKLIAVADEKLGLVIMDFEGNKIQNFRPSEFLATINGVRFHKNDNNVKMVLLICEERTWFVAVYHLLDDNTTSDESEELRVQCPTEPELQGKAQMKFTLMDGVIYLLGTGLNCSIIWTMSMTSLVWKTLIVERTRSSSTHATPTPTHQSKRSVSSLLCQKVKTTDEQEVVEPEVTPIYSSFDVRRWSTAQIRIVLCEADRPRLHILCIGPNGEHLVETQTVKVKRSESQKWIVQGPRLAIWDNEKIIVHDGSGKIFWFNDVSYRIQKIIADMGKSEIVTLQTSSDWCFVLNRSDKCIYSFYYGAIDNI